MGRAPCCDKASVKKGPWSPEEDAKLKSYINEHGTGGNWIALPQKIGLKRCGKSCRLRWLNYLRPNIKHGDFTEQEEQIICSLYISIGSRWSIIAAQLPGRTDNDIKNYWNTKLKKKLLGKRPPSSRRLPAAGASHHQQPAPAASSMPPQLLSSSALERIQLHMKLQSAAAAGAVYGNPALMLPRLAALQMPLDSDVGTATAPPQHAGQDCTAAAQLHADNFQGTYDINGASLSYADLGLHDELYALLYSRSCVQEDYFPAPDQLINIASVVAVDGRADSGALLGKKPSPCAQASSSGGLHEYALEYNQLNL